MQFSTLVESWLQRQDDTTNLQGLARKAGISYSALRRSVQGEVTPSLETMLAVLPLVASFEDMLRCIGELYPNQVQGLAMVLDHNKEIDRRELLHDRESFIILHLATIGKGVAVTWLEETYGRPIRNKIPPLIEAGLIREDNGILYGEPFSYNHNASVLRAIAHTCRLKEFDEPLVTSRFMIEGVSKAGAKEIQRIILEAARKLSETVENHPGNLPMFAGLMTGPFTPLDNPPNN